MWAPPASAGSATTWSVEGAFIPTLTVVVADELRPQDFVDVRSSVEQFWVLGVGALPRAVAERIEVSPDVMGGAPCIRGTRIPVYLIREMLEGDYAADDILREFPGLTPNDVIAAGLMYPDIEVGREEPVTGIP